MHLDDLRFYDTIALWGYGNECIKRYKKQFYVNCFVDNDKNKIGKELYGIKVVEGQYFLENIATSKTLIIISSDKYFEEIVKQVNESINCDIVSLSIMEVLYGISNNSFSIWGGDRLVFDLLTRCGYTIPNISYIEVGANHPIYGSASEIFYLHGARGILVEPNPDLFTELEKFRDGDICVNCGIGGTHGRMQFYRFHNSYRNSFDYDDVKKNIERGWELKDTLEIEVVTLDELIEKYDVNTEKTFLSIEMMGLEHQLKMGFRYEKYRFPIIKIACSFHNTFQDIFDDKILERYSIIAELPRHFILLRKDLYTKIMN